MHIEFELAPIEKKSDYRFVIIFDAIIILYHAVFTIKRTFNKQGNPFLFHRKQLIELFRIFHLLRKMLFSSPHRWFILFRKSNPSLLDLDEKEEHWNKWKNNYRKDKSLI